MTPVDLPPATPVSAEVQPWQGLIASPKPPEWLAIMTDESLSFNERLDKWDAYVTQFPKVDLPLEHTFPPGMYVRKIFMPAGTIVTSRVHLFEHPFFIMQGRCSVISENEGSVVYTAPHSGTTLPNTRRFIYVHEDTVWATVHVNPEDSKDHEELLEAHTFVPENKFLLTV